ncbi:geobacillin-26 family protein [Bacillus sp. FJAT-42315]|uniref:geobacillin-26 family protein n=1 Tax=Bacillus sp. FJAT-42315 TaxID=2014077 RepID=UPI0018E21F15|nr:geobacillin-26 family protein [Bacillus sp. FJAT-42315]
MSATSPFVIGEEKAGGYKYIVIKEQDTFTWEIGHQEKISTIIENQDNEETLEHFRMAVNDINMKIFKMIISIIYILIVVITILILYKKNKQMLKSGGAIIAIFVGAGLYMMLVTSIDLNVAFQDAKFYYLLLMN